LPVCILAGDYNKVWVETQKAMEGRSQAEIDAVLGGTAVKCYNLSV
jgi:L-fuconolactonase